MVILAIEVSTSSVKSLIYDTSQGMLVNNDVPLDSSISDGIVQDPIGIFEAMLAIGKLTVQGYEDEIETLVLSSVWSSLLLTDPSGSPLGLIRTWADVSGAEVLEHYENNQNNKIQYEKAYIDSGCPIHMKYPRWKLHGLISQNKIAVPLDQINISSLPEYLFWRLTGERVISDVSASGSGFMDLEQLKWDEEILESYGLKPQLFGRIVPSTYTTYLPEVWQRRLGLKQKVMVTFPNADGAMNQYAEGRYENNIMSMSIGTSAAIRMSRDHFIKQDLKGLWTHYLGNGNYITGATISGAGNCVQWFMSQMNRENYTFLELEKRLELVDWINAPIFLPFMYGEQSPGWKSRRSYGFCDRKKSHETTDLYYALIEGVLFNLYQGFEIMAQKDLNPKNIKMSGGIINSPFWSQLAVDIFGQEIEVSDIQHSSIMGAIALYIDENGLEAWRPSSVTILKPNLQRKVILRLRYKKYIDYYG